MGIQVFAVFGFCALVASGKRFTQKLETLNITLALLFTWRN
jgi:hypothetical protein